MLAALSDVQHRSVIELMRPYPVVPVYRVVADIAMRFPGCHVTQGRLPFGLETAQPRLQRGVIPTISMATHALPYPIAPSVLASRECPASKPPSGGSVQSPHLPRASCLCCGCQQSFDALRTVHALGYATPCARHRRAGHALGTHKDRAERHRITHGSVRPIRLHRPDAIWL